MHPKIDIAIMTIDFGFAAKINNLDDGYMPMNILDSEHEVTLRQVEDLRRALKKSG